MGGQEGVPVLVSAQLEGREGAEGKRVIASRVSFACAWTC